MLRSLSGAAGGAYRILLQEVRAQGRRLALRGGFLTAAAVFATLALGMLAWAGFLALAILYPPPIAALITAGGLLVLGGVLALIGAKASFRRKEPSRRTPRRAAAELTDEMEAVTEDVERIGRDLGVLATRNSGWLVLGALAAGLAAGFMKKRRP